QPSRARQRCTRRDLGAAAPDRRRRKARCRREFRRRRVPLSSAEFNSGRASTSEQSFTLQANRPTNAAPQQLSTSMSQVVDRWATAILYPAVSYADHGPNAIGESAGAATRFEVNNSPSV